MRFALNILQPSKKIIEDNYLDAVFKKQIQIKIKEV